MSIIFIFIRKTTSWSNLMRTNSKLQQNDMRENRLVAQIISLNKIDFFIAQFKIIEQIFIKKQIEMKKF